MARIESWYKQDLKKPVPIRRMETVFNQDALGHLFGVEVYSNGEAVTLAGSVTGYCLLADGTTVPVSGTRSANRASIVIPQTAYSVIGPITITVKLTEGSAITTLLAVVGVVARSRSGQQVNPGSTITDWTNQISEALQDVEDASAAQDAKISDLKSALIQIGRAMEFELATSGWNEFIFALANGVTYTLTNNTASWIDNIAGRTNGVNTSYHTGQVASGASITFTATKDDANIYMRTATSSGTIKITANGDVSILQAEAEEAITSLQAEVEDVSSKTDTIQQSIKQLGRAQKFEPAAGGWNEFAFLLVKGVTYKLTNNTASWIDNIAGRTNGANTSYHTGQVTVGTSITFTATKDDESLYMRINTASGTIDIEADGDLSFIQKEINSVSSESKTALQTTKQIGRYRLFENTSSGQNWVTFDFSLLNGVQYTIRNIGTSNIDYISGRTNGINNVYSSSILQSNGTLTFTANKNDDYLYMRFYGAGAIEVQAEGDISYLYNLLNPTWKKWNAIGDSITYYDVYEKIVQRELNIGEYTNNGHGGWPLSYVTDQVIAEYSNDYDLITFFMGTNDFGRNVPLETTRANAERIFASLVNKYPTKDIFVFLPLQRWGYTGDESIPGGQAEPTMTNHSGITLRQYCEAIKEEAEKVGIPVCDLYYRSGLIGGDDGNISTYTSDGLHPNTAGYELLSAAMIKFMNHYR